AAWRALLAETPLQPHARHAWDVAADAATHVRLHIYPDGGVARLRVLGAVAGRGASWTRRRGRRRAGCSPPAGAPRPGGTPRSPDGATAAASGCPPRPTARGPRSPAPSSATRSRGIRGSASRVRVPR